MGTMADNTPILLTEFLRFTERRHLVAFTPPNTNRRSDIIFEWSRSLQEFTKLKGHNTFRLLRQYLLLVIEKDHLTPLIAFSSGDTCSGKNAEVVYEHQLALTSKEHPVAARTSVKPIPSAISTNLRPLSALTSNTP